MNWFKKKEIPKIPVPLERVELPDFEPLPELSEEITSNLHGLSNLKNSDKKPFELSSLDSNKTRFENVLESQKIIDTVEDVIENIPEEKFIEKNDYEEAMQLVANFDAAIKNSQSTVDSLVELKNNADQKLEEWRTLLEDAERKLVYADRVMFE